MKSTYAAVLYRPKVRALEFILTLLQNLWRLLYTDLEQIRQLNLPKPGPVMREIWFCVRGEWQVFDSTVFRKLFV